MKRFLSLLVVLGPATAHADKTFNSGRGATWDCAKDDEVTINTSSGTYSFKGACKDINVNGSNLTIGVESVEDITINGAKNTLTLGAVDDIDINGTDNSVTWGKALERKAPKVSNTGLRNTVKTGSLGAAATAAPGGSSDATVLDCAAQTSVSITKGKGTYKVIGTCDKVAISGGDNSVVIEAAKNLAITGSRNQVTIDKVDKIAALGSSNKVRYGAGLSLAKPKTASAGKGNSILALPDLSDKMKTGAAPMTIDCAKTASHSIATNDGSYTFTGTCTLITVDGNNNSLMIASTGGLAVNGNSNSIDVATVGKFATVGNNNTVRWKKAAAGAKPPFSNSGTGNTILKTK